MDMIVAGTGVYAVTVTRDASVATVECSDETWALLCNVRASATGVYVENGTPDAMRAQALASARLVRVDHVTPRGATYCTC
jgi:hypothetical protein